MKKLSLLLFVSLITLTNCDTSKEADFIVLQGKITNPIAADVVLKNNFWEAIDTLSLVEGTFQDTISVPTGYYFLANGEMELRIYLQSGKNLSIDFNTQDINQSLSIGGKGAKENAYLMSAWNSRTFFDYRNLDEASFLLQSDSVKNQSLTRLENTINLDEEFSFLEKNSILIEHAIRVSQFERRKALMLKNPAYKVSDAYPNAFENIDLNEPRLLKTYSYTHLLSNYVGSQVHNSEGYAASADFYVLFQEYLAQSKLAPEIKDRLGLENSEFGFVYSKSKDKYYETYLNYVQNESYKNSFISSYDALNTNKGVASPNFKFKGFDDKWYTLDDFKNKYVYIDLWTSWCVPCIAQIPQLKALGEKFKEKVHIVSIAWNDDYNSWKKMVIAQELEGIQLFAENKNDEFFKFYDVEDSGIPRFILLDKQGNIIETRAEPPTRSFIADQLNQLE